MKRIALTVLAAAAATLVAGSATASHPGKNGRIAFAAGNRLADYEIYTIEASGSGLKRLTSNAVLDAAPSFSPNGTLIAFRRDVGGRGKVFVMNADGSAPRQLSATDTAGFDSQPTWSPDGKRIAFASSRKGISQVFVMSSDGSGVKQLTAETSGITSPSWSPKGETIAFVRGGDIFLRTDSGVRRLTSTPDAEEIEPVWSPDGARIAFLSNRDAGTEDIGSGYELYVMGADGSGAKRLTDNTGDFGHAAWAPDGAAIAFTRFAGSDLRLFLIAPDGSNLRQVTASLPSTPTGLDWGPAPKTPGQADVALSMAGGDVRTEKGAQLTTFELAVKNLGPDEATAVRLTIDLAGDAELWGAKPGSWKCSASKIRDKWQNACTLAGLARGATAPFAVTLRSRSGQPAKAAANVFAAERDPVGGNNGAALAPGADLAVSIAAPAAARIGKRVDFTVVITNRSSKASGPFGARADIDDDRPGPKLGYVVGTLREAGEWPDSPVCAKAYTLCHAGLAAGKSARFRLDAKPTAKVSLIATATVRSYGAPDPVPANDSARGTVIVR